MGANRLPYSEIVHAVQNFSEDSFTESVSSKDFYFLVTDNVYWTKMAFGV